jgi:hypothetical protein
MTHISKIGGPSVEPPSRGRCSPEAGSEELMTGSQHVGELESGGWLVAEPAGRGDWM